jgi:threonine dehydratase
MFGAVKPVSIAEIESARERLEELRLVSPLVAGNASPAGKTVLRKLENLQPIGSFKVRPIGNTVLRKTPAGIARGNILPQVPVLSLEPRSNATRCQC